MIKLNLARSCLRYLINFYGIKEIFLPYYSCNTLWSAVKKENCKIRFYHIGNDFLPVQNFKKTDFILYINYFGLCTHNCKILSKKYPNLIIDNTQAFYSKPYGLACFNSLRKFFPVQNGAYLYMSEEKTVNNIYDEDEFLYTSVAMSENYEQFVKNELLLNNQEIKYIYPQIEVDMRNCDYEKNKQTRIKKFWEYHKIYNGYNRIKLTPDEDEIPYCYPLCTTDETVQARLKSYRYPLLSLWGEIQKDFPEHEFLNNTVALPLL